METPKEKAKMSDYTVNIYKREKLIIIETDFDFLSFQISKFQDYFQPNFKMTKNKSIGFALFFKDFGGRKYYPDKIESTFRTGRKISIRYSIKPKDDINQTRKQAKNES